MAGRYRRVAETGILVTPRMPPPRAQVQAPRIPPAHMHDQQPWQQPRQQQRPPSSLSAPLMRSQMARLSYDMQYDESYYSTDPYYSTYDYAQQVIIEVKK